MEACAAARTDTLNECPGILDQHLVSVDKTSGQMLEQMDAAGFPC